MDSIVVDKQGVKLEYNMKHTKQQRPKPLQQIACVFIYLKYSMHCQATINITVLKFKAEVLNQH